MIIGKRLIKVLKSGHEVCEILIRCDNKLCNKEFYVEFGLSHKKKFCCRSCVNTGRKHTDEWKADLSIKNSGENNPFYGKKHTPETIIILKQNAPFAFEKFKNRTSEEDLKIWREKQSENNSGKKNGFYGKKHTVQTRRHLSEVKSEKIANGTINLKSANYGLKGYYFSSKMEETYYYDSFIELLRMKMLDLTDEVISWTKRHNIRIKYKFDGNDKHYVPDFVIVLKSGQIIVEELKGYKEHETKKQKKFCALRKYCKKNNMISSIWLYEDINDLCLFYFGKTTNSLRVKYHKGLFI